MSDYSLEPSDPRKEVTADVEGQRVTARFYPGFARAITLNGTQVYDQKADGPLPFVLPPGAEKPFSTSALEFSSTKGYRVTVTLDDPDHLIDRIEVVVRDPRAGVKAMMPDGGTGGDTWGADNTPVLCPPMCNP
ncbi:MAG TPA: hypothetical protein VJT67_13235 [Longimicrobiaceae bacterium]|nr:hypothetical protein [Longimicrobiaceae bacterium]